MRVSVIKHTITAVSITDMHYRSLVVSFNDKKNVSLFTMNKFKFYKLNETVAQISLTKELVAEREKIKIKRYLNYLSNFVKRLIN